jgi:hypothetical protein
MRWFYRRYCARYALARKLKPLLVWAWFGFRHARHVITWRFQHSMHVMAFRLSGKSHIFTPAKALLARWMHHSWVTDNAFFSMLSLREYCNEGHPKIYMLTPNETAILGMPDVHPDHYGARLYSGEWSTKIPAVRAIEISDAEVMGKCDFVFTRAHCVHHDLYNFNRDLPAEEMHGMIRIDAKKGLIFRYVQTFDPIEGLSTAISLIGSASANYVHWLTETLPKLALIDEVDDLISHPLIIDADLHPNIVESIRYVNIHNRKLIPLKRGQVCKVDKLISISPVAYVPFDYRRGVNLEKLGIKPDWAMFVPRGLHMLRHRLLPRLAAGDTNFRRRLFLRRNSQFRQMHNASEVESLLQEMGFQLVEPETLSFSDQVKLFSSAEIIVAQAGAALGNMVFAPKDSHFVILSAWSSFSIYYYFSNIASILGQRCTYVLCNPDGQGDAHPAHQGFEVDIDALRMAIT